MTQLAKPAEQSFCGSCARFLAAFWKLAVLLYSGFNCTQASYLITQTLLGTH